MVTSWRAVAVRTSPLPTPSPTAHSYTVLKRRFYGLARSKRASGKDPMAVGMVELCAALFPFVEEIKRKWKARQEHARRERRLARRQAEVEMKELEATSK